MKHRGRTFLRPALFTAHCSNKVKDEDEHGIDCGGSCSPCTVCTPGKYNTLIMRGFLLFYTVGKVTKSLI